MSKIALVSGGSGLIGQALLPSLVARGFEPKILSRRIFPSPYPIVEWSAERGAKRPEELENAQLLIHLAGANVGGRRWSESFKREIEESRIQGTRVLISQLGALKHPPKTIVSAGAVGIYGNRADEVLTEESGAGTGFLPGVAAGWEQEVLNAAAFGARIAIARFGIVLARDGGALQKMILPFSLGLGGPIGNGNQWMSWVSLRDAVQAMMFMIEQTSLSGAFNVVAPQPVTNTEFTKALGRALRRPTFFRVPAWAVSLLFGEMGDTLLLGSARVLPKRLLESGFRFQDREIQGAMLQAVLGE